MIRARPEAETKGGVRGGDSPPAQQGQQGREGGVGAFGEGGAIAPRSGGWADRIEGRRMGRSLCRTGEICNLEPPPQAGWAGTENRQQRNNNNNYYY